MRYMLSFQCETEEEAQAVLSAVAGIGKQPHACSRQYLDSKQLLENTLDQLGVGKPAAESAEPTDEKRKNISPGASSITKIGSKTKETIFGYLHAGQQPGNPYAEHMKLLWSRGEVKFDGTDYYL